MSEIHVSKKRTTSKEASIADVFSPVMPFLAIPFVTMRGVAEGVDHVFGFTAGADAGRWAPAIDVEQREGHLVASVELPGLKKDEVKVEFTPKFLFITGEHKREHPVERKGTARYERHYGKFYRSVPLPEGAKTEHIKAHLLDGVLTISVPVAERESIAA